MHVSMLEYGREMEVSFLVCLLSGKGVGVGGRGRIEQDHLWKASLVMN